MEASVFTYCAKLPWQSKQSMTGTSGVSGGSVGERAHSLEEAEVGKGKLEWEEFWEISFRPRSLL